MFSHLGPEKSSFSRSTSYWKLIKIKNFNIELLQYNLINYIFANTLNMEAVKLCLSGENDLYKPISSKNMR